MLKAALYLLIIVNIHWTCTENKHIDFSQKMDNTTLQNSITDTAYFGSGCFWCTESFFQRLEGVISVTSGYGGGFVENPTYEDICYKKTGHTELVKVVFNPEKISYDELLEVFWKTHDPTTLNQQGADVGFQYRSVIFYINETQKQKATYYKEALTKNHVWDKPIVTTIEPFKNFYSAENYHQNYYNNNPEKSYCKYVIQPKLSTFEKIFKDKLKKEKQ
ncbi:MAG: peptide-methionine (S)-S-oxide reductase MsrA [Chitinophagaceae bacterium]|nr:peptide-methionine (S)-S-oxide reductase MsrA [Chitinophagaceae bacterium]MCW5905366.1 peptide-methionine (S)-S-oxide reductase MsrA [Chitinophagaceae bacterium]